MVIHYLQCGAQPAVLPCLHAMYPDKFQVSCVLHWMDVGFNQGALLSDWILLSAFDLRKPLPPFQKINDIDTIDINEKLEPYHSDNNQTIGELFLGFLDYYNHFKYDNHIFLLSRKLKESWKFILLFVVVLGRTPYQCEQPVCCRSTIAAKPVHTKTIQTTGSNYASKVTYAFKHDLVEIKHVLNTLVPFLLCRTVRFVEYGPFVLRRKDFRAHQKDLLQVMAYTERNKGFG